MSKIYKNNKSGTPGVCYKVRDARWCATININGEKLRLGNFTNKDDAIQARIEAEKFYKFRFNEKDGYKLIHYTLQIELGVEENDKDYKTFYEYFIPFLYYAAKNYDGTTSFRKYAIDVIKANDKHLVVDYSDLEIVPYYKDWLDGETMRQISKKYNIPLTTLNKNIKDMSKKIKILQKNVDL